MAGTKPLVMVIDGNVDGLKTAARAAQTLLKDLENGAVATREAYVDEFDRIANISKAAMDQMAKGISADINRMKREAQQAARIGSDFNPVAGFSSDSQQRFADNSRKLAAQLFEQEAAFRKLAQTGGELDATYERAANEALAHAKALTLDADAAERVADDLRKVEVATAATEVAGKRSVAMSGAMRAGWQDAGFQVSDFAVQVGGGTSAIRAGAQQAPQLIQALALMGYGAENSGSKFAKFATFMGGPWGAAITVGISILGALATKFLDTKDAADKAESQTFDFSKSLDFVALKADAAQDAIRQLVGETEKLVKVEGDYSKQVAANAERGLADAQDRLAKAEQRVRDIENAPGLSKRVEQLFTIDDARAEVEAAKTSVAEAKKAADNAELGLSQRAVLGKLDPYQGKLDAINEQIAALNSRRTTSSDAERLDPLVRNYYLRKNNAIYISEDEYQAEFARLKKLQEQVQKAQSEAKREPRHNGGPSLAEGQSANLLASAQKYLGLTEAGDRSTLKSLFKQAGENVDPKITAWCAAFVNAVLATNGLPGSGSLSARSFLDYGSRVDKPEKGDIVVLKRGNSATEGHVGFYAGQGKGGTILVTGGNQGDKVSTAAFKQSDVLGYRRAPTGDQVYAAQQKLDEKAQRDQQALDAAMLASKEQAAKLARDGVTDAAVLAELDKKAIDAGLQRKLAQNAKLALDHQDLDALDRANAEVEKRAIDEKQRREVADKALQRERDHIDAASTLLELQGQLATSMSDRKAIALQLLDLWRKQARAAADQKFNQDGDVGAWLDTIGLIDQEYGLKRKGLDQQFRSPLQAYSDQLHQNVDDLDGALENVEAHGLQSLEEGLLGLVNGTETVASAFKKMAASIIADLARIAIEKAVLSIFAFHTGDVPAHATGDIPGFASGIISGPGTGTSDSILAWHEGKGLIRVSNGESIITAEGTRKHRSLLKAINDNALPAFSSGMVGDVAYPAIPPSSTLRAANDQPRQYFDLRGAVVTEDLYRHMNAIGAHYAAQALAAAPSLTRQEMSDDAAQRIPL